MNRIEQYKALVETANAVDYANRATIRRANKAVSEMYSLVRSSVRDGPEAVDELAGLLDHPNAARWLAHQLVECADLPKSIEDRCFRLIQRLAKGGGADALGEQIWLREWKSKKKRK